MAIRIGTVLVLLLLAAGLCDPPELSSCGPFLPEAVFTLSRMPENAADEYAHGRLGILQPGFTRFYLVIAYRYLAGVGLNDAARKALFGAEPSPESSGTWLATRAKAAGAGPAPKIEVFKQIQKPGYFNSYVNCSDDAFRNAAGHPGRPHPEIRSGQPAGGAVGRGSGSGIRQLFGRTVDSRCPGRRRRPAGSRRPRLPDCCREFLCREVRDRRSNVPQDCR